jgi:GNAT superfamily N-acetyltransferase
MGRNNGDFHGVTFRHQPSASGGHFIFASHPEAEAEGRNTVGYLQIMPSGEVRDVYVDEDYRGKGIATGMWTHAKKVGLNPIHSSEQTSEGASWAKSVGD